MAKSKAMIKSFVFLSYSEDRGYMTVEIVHLVDSCKESLAAWEKHLSAVSILSFKYSLMFWNIFNTKIMGLEVNLS